MKPRESKENNCSGEHAWFCDSLGCYEEATQRVLVRISPQAVTYCDLCDECAKRCAVRREDLTEYTDLVLGHYALLQDGDISNFCLCACGHGKECHELTSCIGRDEEGRRCACRGFSP